MNLAAINRNSTVRLGLLMAAIALGAAAIIYTRITLCSANYLVIDWLGYPAVLAFAMVVASWISTRRRPANTTVRIAVSIIAGLISGAAYFIALFIAVITVLGGIFACSGGF